MADSVSDRLFELQYSVLSKKETSPDVLVGLIRECVQEQLELNNTLFSKLLSCIQTLETAHLEEIFDILRSAADGCIISAPEAALSYFKAAQDCIRRINTFRYRKAA